MSSGVLNERESAMEAAWINREEQKMLQKLLSKAKKQVDHAEDHALDITQLKKILPASAVNQKLLDSLIEWKYHAH